MFRIAVSLFAGPHGVVACAIEDGSHHVVSDVIRAVFSALPVGQMPDGPASHDHVARRGANRAAEGAHLIRAVENHSFGGELLDRRCIAN